MHVRQRAAHVERQRACERCGTPFRSARSDQRFCAPECRRSPGAGQPFARLRPCTWPRGCDRQQLASRCPDHERERKRGIDAARGSRQARGYDRAWELVRLEILERDGWRCQVSGPRCVGTADRVDHIVPLSAGGPRLDPSNLRAACRPCNPPYARRQARTLEVT